MSIKRTPRSVKSLSLRIFLLLLGVLFTAKSGGSDSSMSSIVRKDRAHTDRAGKRD